tara:strand:- start:759 stop:983 length:225 start_codon:yes stop_codon:yes gene_type:complete
MSKLNAGNIYLNAIKDIVNTPTTSNEKPSKFSGGGLMGNGSGKDTDVSEERPYYEAHQQAFLDIVKMREKVRNG